MEFIAFDLETTGTVAGVDQIVELGAVRFQQGQPTAVFSTLVNPRRPIPPGASKVNGITDDMVTGKPFIEEILESFAEFCAATPLVAHNAPFDTQFILADIKKHQSGAPKGIVLDTLSMARRVYPGLPNYRLGTLVQHLGISSSNFHRAEEDASYCGHLFWKILQKISPEANLPFENLIALTGKAEVRFPQIVRQPRQLNFLESLV